MATRKKSRKTSARPKKKASPKKKARKTIKARRTRAPARKAAAPRKAARPSGGPVTAAKPRLLPPSAALEAAVETAGGRVDALQDKLRALGRIEDALRLRLTNTAADENELIPNLNAIANAKRVVQAQIADAQTGTLAPPSAADVAALRAAIRDAENAIAQNAAVNQLAKAATALIKTLSA